MQRDYERYLASWLAAGKPVTPITCPHCSQKFDVPQIPDTDSATCCVKCGELFMKVIDHKGRADGYARPLPWGAGP